MFGCSRQTAALKTVAFEVLQLAESIADEADREMITKEDVFAALPEGCFRKLFGSDVTAEMKGEDDKLGADFHAYLASRDWDLKIKFGSVYLSASSSLFKPFGCAEKVLEDSNLVFSTVDPPLRFPSYLQKVCNHTLNL